MPTSAFWLPPVKTSLWMITSPSCRLPAKRSMMIGRGGPAPFAMIEAYSVWASVRPSASNTTVTRSPISLKIGERDERIRTVAISCVIACTRRCRTAARMRSGCALTRPT